MLCWRPNPEQKTCSLLPLWSTQSIGPRMECGPWKQRLGHEARATSIRLPQVAWALLRDNRSEFMINFTSRQQGIVKYASSNQEHVLHRPRQVAYWAKHFSFQTHCNTRLYWNKVVPQMAMEATDRSRRLGANVGTSGANATTTCLLLAGHSPVCVHAIAVTIPRVMEPDDQLARFVRLFAVCLVSKGCARFIQLYVRTAHSTDIENTHRDSHFRLC